MLTAQGSLWEPFRAPDRSAPPAGTSIRVHPVHGPAGRPCVLVDRDGTLTHYTPGHVTRDVDLHPIRGVREALRELVVLHGAVVLVVTNQSSVGRGMMSTLDYQRINVRLRHLFPELTGVFTCPHIPEAGCTCRKPSPGLIHQASRYAMLHHNARTVCMVGDAQSDMDAARICGVRPVRVRSGSQLGMVKWHGDVYEDFVHFVENFERYAHEA